MIFLVRQRLHGRPPPIAGTILYGSVPVVYAAGLLGGQPIVYAQIPDGPDQAAVVSAATSQLGCSAYPSDPGIRDLEGRPLVPSVVLAAALVADAPSPPEPEPRARALDTFPPPEDLFTLARRLGWTDEDLAGLSEASPGEDGGRSPRSGLTLAEMVLVKAPPEWPELASTGYPWQSGNWQPPPGSWQAPSAPAKVRLAEPTEPGPVTAPEDAVMTPSDPHAIDPDEEEIEELDPDSYELETPSAETAELSEAMSGDQAAAIAKIIVETWNADGQGSIPHINKINFKLDKAGLPRVKAADVKAVIAAQSGASPAQES